jgi:hypothetical protein
MEQENRDVKRNADTKGLPVDYTDGKENTAQNGREQRVSAARLQPFAPQVRRFLAALNAGISPAQLSGDKYLHHFFHGLRPVAKFELFMPFVQVNSGQHRGRHTNRPQDLPGK